MKKITLDTRFSTCPNDTFIFDALVNGRLNTGDLSFKTTLTDIDLLNQSAAAGLPDVVKISYHAYALLTHDYIMLDAGSALGFGVGPLLVALRPIALEELSALRVAIPGEMTTAAMLLRLALPEVKNTVVMRFSQIEEAVINGQADAGVIIHEGRFTYAAKGLTKLADLGELWELLTGLPIPLGGIAVKRSLRNDTIRQLNSLLGESIALAHENPDAAMPFVTSYAREMDPEVIRKHIGLYVNAATRDVGLQGRLAVRYITASLSPGLSPDFPLFASELDNEKMNANRTHEHNR